MIKYKKSVVLSFLFCIQSVSAQTLDNTVISIAANDSDYLLSSKLNKKGPYNYLVDKFKEKTSVAFKLIYFPPARSAKLLANKQIDCLMPANINQVEQPEQHVASIAFNYARAYVFTKNNRPVIQSFAALDGKILATRRGYHYGGISFGSSIKSVQTNTIKQSILMLEKERIDAFIAYSPDILGTLKDFNSIDFHYDKSFVIHQQAEQIVCQKTQQNKQFIKELNQAITELKASGELDLILKQTNF